MVPSGSASRQVLIWSVPTLVILLSLVWYRRKRSTLRTDPGGTSDSATKVKADKETNGIVYPTDRILPEKLEQEVKKSVVVQGAVPKEVSKCVIVQEAVSKEVKKPCVEQEAVPKEVKKSVVQEAVPEEVKKSVVQEAVPEEVKKSVVQEAVPEEVKKSVVQEAVPEEVKKSVVQEAVPEELKKSVVQEPVSEEVKKSIVQEAVPEEVKKSVVQEAVPEEVKKSIVQEAVPEEVKKSIVQEAVPEEAKKSVVQEAVPEEVKKSVVQEAVPEEVKKSVVQEAVPKELEKSLVQEAVPEELVKTVVQESVPEEVKKPCVEQEVVRKEVEKSVVQEAVLKEVKKPCVEQEAVTKEVAKSSVVEEAVTKEVEKATVAHGAVTKEVEKQVAVKKAVPKETKQSVVQEAVPKEVAVKKAGPKEAKKSRGQQGAVPKEAKVEGPVVKKAARQESLAKSAAMSKGEVVGTGGAPAAVLQEEKVGTLGGKLASLSLEEQRTDADRDSANHSPVDAMLASPSLSNYSDEHSEGSSDSGKGCSDVASPPSRTPLGGSSLAGDAEVEADADARYTVYEFLLPHYLVGRLIGPRGSFVQEIKSKTNATVQVKRHPEMNKQKICVVDGTQSEVDAALAMIRDKYPLRKYPTVTLEQVCILTNVQPTCALIPEYCQLHLVEGVNNEVMVSCMVSPGHMFLQQPYHPTFQYLNRLSEAMTSVYSHADAPHVPEPITVGSICVAPATEGWYRVQVVSVDDESHSCEVKFVDHGGYMTISNSSLRQIHHDFMSVPFQATECFLASIKPAGGSHEWSDEAVRLVDELTRGQMLYAQVYDYTEYSIPLVYLYCCINSLVVLINQELVARGLAEVDDVASAEPVAAAEAAALVAAAAEVAPLTRQAPETPSEVQAV